MANLHFTRWWMDVWLSVDGWALWWVGKGIRNNSNLSVALSGWIDNRLSLAIKAPH